MEGNPYLHPPPPLYLHQFKTLIILLPDDNKLLEGNLIWSVRERTQQHVFQDYSLEIINTSPRGQWVNDVKIIYYNRFYVGLVTVSNLSKLHDWHCGDRRVVTVTVK